VIPIAYPRCAGNHFGMRAELWREYPVLLDHVGEHSLEKCTPWPELTDATAAIVKRVGGSLRDR